jgi:trk system potassium uptake protein TrkA
MKFLIVGCGRMGAELAQILGQRGYEVSVVDKDPDAFVRLGSSFKGQLIPGVGFDRNVLCRAGIEQADGLAAVTGSDEANVVIARLALQFFHVPKVVAYLYDPRKAEIYRRLGLQTISPLTWGIQRIAELLSFSELNITHSLGSGEVDLIEVEVLPLLVGRTVNELTMPSESQVIAIQRRGQTFIPSLGTTFQTGDVIHVAVLATSAPRLQSLLGMH